MKKTVLTIYTLVITVGISFAQLEGINPDYLNTLQKRANKIVTNMQLNDSAKAERVIELIVIQYYQLSKIHDAREAMKDSISNLAGEDEEKAKEQIRIETEAAFYRLHAAYIGSLSAELSPDQIDIVKDGMTYGVMKRTYDGYLDLLPDLTDEHKRYIYRNLVEAREYAMNGGSSKEKHAWFGKYKGRINNYLSRAGYDLRKAEEEREKRH